jgi:MOSC domain-containing protein YiiM
MSKIIEIGITKKNNQKLKIEKVNNVEAVAGKGIKGDRNYHDYNEARKQITLIESESIDYYNQKFNTNFSYLDLRRNLITKNIQLNELVGKKLSIGQIDIQVHDLCRPCNYLQEILGKDNIIKEFLRRGGLRCEILISGNIKVGDEIKIL